MSLNSFVYAVYIPKDLTKPPQLIIYEGRQTVVGFSLNTVGGVYVADQQTTHLLTDDDFGVPFTLPEGGTATYFKKEFSARARLDLVACQRIQQLDEIAAQYRKAWSEQVKEFESGTGTKLADHAKEVIHDVSGD